MSIAHMATEATPPRPTQCGPHHIFSHKRFDVVGVLAEHQRHELVVEKNFDGPAAPTDGIGKTDALGALVGVNRRRDHLHGVELLDGVDDFTMSREAVEVRVDSGDLHAWCLDPNR